MGRWPHHITITVENVWNAVCSLKIAYNPITDFEHILEPENSCMGVELIDLSQYTTITDSSSAILFSFKFLNPEFIQNRHKRPFPWTTCIESRHTKIYTISLCLKKQTSTEKVKKNTGPGSRDANKRIETSCWHPTQCTSVSLHVQHNTSVWCATGQCNTFIPM